MKSFGTPLAVCLSSFGKQGLRGNREEELLSSSFSCVSWRCNATGKSHHLSLCFLICEMRVTAFLAELFLRLKQENVPQRALLAQTS